MGCGERVAAVTRALRVALCAALLLGGACDRASTGGFPAPPSVFTAAAPEIEPALPISSSTTPAPSDGLLVLLSRKVLSLGRDGATLAVPDLDTNAWSKGFEGKYKRSSRNDFFLLPLGAALQAAYPGEASVPAVVIAADASISYRMLTETVYTLGQERVRTVDLLVRSVAGKVAIPLTLPGHPDLASPISDEARRTILQSLAGDSGAPSAHSASLPAPVASASAQSTPPVPLNLNVIVTNPGFVVSAARRRMAPGCHEAGEGAAVPRHDDAYDFATLTACATTIKSSEPRFATVMRVTVSADPGVDVQTLTSTLDALRGADGRLFPEVMLGVPK
jgi:hypothetical protein